MYDYDYVYRLSSAYMHAYAKRLQIFIRSGACQFKVLSRLSESIALILATTRIIHSVKAA